MDKEYDLVFVTNCPAFYKINLFNAIAEKARVLAIFIGVSKEVVIDKDFAQQVCFDFIQVGNTAIETRNRLRVFGRLFKIICGLRYKYIIYDGYDMPEVVSMMFWTRKSKNCLICESSVFESCLTGIKGRVKKVILNRISVGFPCGELQARIFKTLGFKGEIRKTYGVGIFKKGKRPDEPKELPVSFRYVFVGRLVSVKNIELLIEVFNKNGKNLTIVGCGILEKELRKKANENILFTGFIPNEELYREYPKHDVFILPSSSETWGLVVEEAIYYGLPVIVSSVVGCLTELVEEPETGIVFRNNDAEDLNRAILQMEQNYSFYKGNAEHFSFEKRDEQQVEAYVGLLNI